ncbi:hypothetical protein BDM02DRAFT_3110300 [Thelephora ganbajun]|uniref:Uncharacterized protein n=1 Tax=Thelephora ganbajun TaxID=370292 RepID=A0ACB6ZPH5_THEGA|nr:hypothetical protein BDM02DRAFT_3110300 [Thelephora ganbajun]
MTNKLLTLVASSTTNSGGKGKARLIVDQDDVVDDFDSVVVDVMDQLLERVDSCLDVIQGHNKAPVIPINPNPVETGTKTNASRGRLDPALQHASHITKPQLKFNHKPNNHRNYRWCPSLKHKYNARVPLGYFSPEDQDESISRMPHPYQYEITHISYPPSVFQASPPHAPSSFEETPFTWVSTPQEFQVMMGKLRQVKEIAVDLEHHRHRSFNGFVCLMQISTRHDDFIVDTLILREDLEELNEIFTNPNVLKVFHGAESDIVWLQENFEIYVVGLFDTYYASKVLELPRHGLATLLGMYCDFAADKRYQQADWRIRPLPKEMLAYARSDTHFLLFIYDNLRNALLDRASSRSQSRTSETPQSQAGINFDPKYSLLGEVMSRSEETSLRLHRTENYDEEGSGPGGWDTIARKWNKVAFTRAAHRSIAKSIYLRIHDWRDRVAREEDESTTYVLPQHYLFQLAEQPPNDLPALLNIFRTVPPVIKRRANELLDEIRAGGSESVDISRPRKTVADLGQTNDTRPVKDIVQSDFHSESGPFEQLFPPLNTLFSVRQMSYKATSSLLLGAEFSSNRTQLTRPHFSEVKSKIHDALVVAPTIIRAAKTEAEAIALHDSLGSVARAQTTTAQIEVAFVPASERQHTTSEIADTIITVGQRSQQKKKRKRNPASNVPENDVEMFDYTAEPGLLDVSDMTQVGPVTKKRSKEPASMPYGNFPAPPKAHSQPKSGNQSHSFR